MTVPQIATQAALVLAAAVCVAWAFVEARRDPERIPLTRGVSLASVVVALLVLVPTVPVLYVILRYELIPRGSPLAFTVFLGATATATIAAMIAVITIHTRRVAAGWLVIEGRDRFRVVAPGVDETVTLGPGVIRAFPVEGKPEYLQFQIISRGGTLLLLALVAMKDHSLAEQDRAVAPAGLVLASSRRFCDLVRPHVAPRAS